MLFETISIDYFLKNVLNAFLLENPVFFICLQIFTACENTNEKRRHFLPSINEFLSNDLDDNV